MKIIAFISCILLLFAIKRDHLITDWDNCKLPANWTMTIKDSAVDYFNFGNPYGQLVFENQTRKVVYYIYDMSVEEKIESGQYTAFFSNKNCQEYSNWKEGGFPNFAFKNRLYIIDLCHTAPFMHNDDEYLELSRTLFDYSNKK